MAVETPPSRTGVRSPPAPPVDEGCSTVPERASPQPSVGDGRSSLAATPSSPLPPSLVEDNLSILPPLDAVAASSAEAASFHRPPLTGEPHPRGGGALRNRRSAQAEVVTFSLFLSPSLKNGWTEVRCPTFLQGYAEDPQWERERKKSVMISHLKKEVWVLAAILGAVG